MRSLWRLAIKIIMKVYFYGNSVKLIYELNYSENKSKRFVANSYLMKFKRTIF